MWIHHGDFTETEQGVAQAILRGVIDFKRDPWPIVSDKAKSLVRQMLEPDPRRRLTAQQVLGIVLEFLNFDHNFFISICRVFLRLLHWRRMNRMEVKCPRGL